MEFLPFALILLGGASIVALFDSLDDDNNNTTDLTTEEPETEEPETVEPEPEEPEPEEPEVENPEILASPDGNTFGTAGDDLIVAKGDGVHDWDFHRFPSNHPHHVSSTTSRSEYLMEGEPPFEHTLDADGNDVGEPVDSIPGLTFIDAGAGNDTITASGNDILVWAKDNDGADSIDASGMVNGIIKTYDGDYVRGSDVADADLMVMGNDYTFEGGLASEYAYVGGTGQAAGGGGNDTLLAGQKASLSGGDGDDVLKGNFDGMQDSGLAYQFKDWTNDAANKLDGGAGADTISFDFSDTVTGGAGEDVLEGFLSPDNEAATITDFVPAEDSLKLWMNEGADSVTLEVSGNDTNIMLDGTVLCVIKGQTDLTIGYFQPEIYQDSTGNWVDQNGYPVDLDFDADGNPLDGHGYPIVASNGLMGLDGNPISEDDVDIVIHNYPNVVM